MFSIRLLEDEDYNELLTWWSWFKFPAPRKDCLPDNGKSGIMVSRNGQNIAAGFLYFTNSKLCWIEFIVSNPEYKDKDRKEAIKTLIHELCHVAKIKGFAAVFTSVKHQGLMKHYEACGFTKGSNNTHEMIAVL